MTNLNPFKVGDRVRWVEKTAINGLPQVWEKPGTERIVIKVMGMAINVDGPSPTGAHHTGIFHHTWFEPVPDRSSLPIKEAYPVGSVWNHQTYGDEPFRIVGHSSPTMVDLTYGRSGDPEKPHTWHRETLDTYGLLVMAAPTAEKVQEELDQTVSKLVEARNERDDIHAKAEAEVTRLNALLRDALEASEDAQDETRILCKVVDYTRSLGTPELDAHSRGYENGLRA